MISSAFLVLSIIEKSFYSLEYTTGCLSEAQSSEKLVFEDYSKIIEELQSHRKEIEKLQVDITNTTCHDEDEGQGCRQNKGLGLLLRVQGLSHQQ